MFVFDVISLPFSFPVGDVSDDDDAVTDVILFSCIFCFFLLYRKKKFTQDDDDNSERCKKKTVKIYEKFFSPCTYLLDAFCGFAIVDDDDDSWLCVCANAVWRFFSLFVCMLSKGVGLGGWRFSKRREKGKKMKKSKKKLFTRRKFSNFDKIALLSSPLFNAVVELCLFVLVSPSCDGFFFFFWWRISRFESFMLLFVMI